MLNWSQARRERVVEDFRATPGERMVREACAVAGGEIDAYQQIGEYAYISDCHCGALISRDGSVDWCCMPRLDAASVFGRLLDAGRGGFCSIRPEIDDAGVTRRYADECAPRTLKEVPV